MGTYIVRRVLGLIPAILLVSVVAFMFMHFIPGNPAAVRLGPSATTEQIERLTEKMGLNKPVYIQFERWFWQVLQGDFGESLFFQQSVLSVIGSRAETSILLATLGMMVVVLVGLPLGVISAVRRNTWIDQVSLTVSFLGAGIPDFWLGLLLMLVFAVTLGWFPTSGFPSVFAEGGIANLRYLILPALTLGIPNAALLTRLTRSSMLEILSLDYISTAKAKGLPQRTVILKHALRNCAIPVITTIAFTLVILMAQAVVTESVFALPGIGRLVISSVLRRDYPVLQGVLLVTAFLYLFVNLLADVAYGLLDPRIKY